MAVNNYFDHPGTDGLRVGARASAAGYSYGRVSENIARGHEVCLYPMYLLAI
jgi:uncharacterized protein YkwD